MKNDCKWLGNKFRLINAIHGHVCLNTNQLSGILQVDGGNHSLHGVRSRSHGDLHNDHNDDDDDRCEEFWKGKRYLM